MSLPIRSFYFIRHGETDWNKNKIIMGSKDIPLNERGIEQAYKAKKHFQGKDFSVIYSSDLIRTKQTASIINEEIQVPIIFNESLRERSWGELEGKSHNMVLSDLSDEQLLQGGEEFGKFEERVLKALKEILSLPEKALIVAHGGVFVILARYLGYPSLRSPNCMPFYFQATKDSWLINNLSDEVFDW